MKSPDAVIIIGVKENSSVIKQLPRSRLPLPLYFIIFYRRCHGTGKKLWPCCSSPAHIRFCVCAFDGGCVCAPLKRPHRRFVSHIVTWQEGLWGPRQLEHTYTHLKAETNERRSWAITALSIHPCFPRSTSEIPLGNCTVPSKGHDDAWLSLLQTSAHQQSHRLVVLWNERNTFVSRFDSSWLWFYITPILFAAFKVKPEQPAVAPLTICLLILLLLAISWHSPYRFSAAQRYKWQYILYVSDSNMHLSFTPTLLSRTRSFLWRPNAVCSKNKMRILPWQHEGVMFRLFLSEELDNTDRSSREAEPVQYMTLLLQI